MKEFIKIPSKYYILMLAILVAWIIFWKVYFKNNEIESKANLKRIVGEEVNGIIQESEENNRGFKSFTIRDNHTKSKRKLNLHITWFYEENNIQVNDSVSKTANSKIITFYKLKNGVYEECCEYEIEVE